MYHYLWLDYFFSIHYKYVLINKNLILIIFVFLLNIFLSRDSSFICVFRNSTFRLKRQRNKMKDKKQAVINWTIFICIFIYLLWERVGGKMGAIFILEHSEKLKCIFMIRQRFFFSILLNTTDSSSIYRILLSITRDKNIIFQNLRVYSYFILVWRLSRVYVDYFTIIHLS